MMLTLKVRKKQQNEAVHQNETDQVQILLKMRQRVMRAAVG